MRLFSRKKITKTTIKASKSVELNHFPPKEMPFERKLINLLIKNIYYIYLFILALIAETVFCNNSPKTMNVNLCLFNLCDNLMC